MTPLQRRIIINAKRYIDLYGEIDIEALAFAVNENEIKVANIIKRFYRA